MELGAFTPITPSVSIAAGTTTGSTALTATGAVSPGKVVRVFNSGQVPVFIKFGDSTVAALTTSTPIAPGATELFQLGSETYVAAITASGSATIYFTSGQGS